MPSKPICGYRRRSSSTVKASVDTPKRASIACVARRAGVQVGAISSRPVRTRSGTPNSASRAVHASIARCAIRA